MSPVDDISRVRQGLQIHQKKRKGLQGASQRGMVMGRHHVPLGPIVIAIGDIRGLVVGQGIGDNLWKDLERKEDREKKKKEKRLGIFFEWHKAILKGPA